MVDSNAVVAGGLVGGVVYALSYFITKSVRITSANYIEQLKQLRLDNKQLREEIEEISKKAKATDRRVNICTEERWQLIRFMESKGHNMSEFKTRHGGNVDDFIARDGGPKEP
jgi:hypothetical protein